MSLQILGNDEHFDLLRLISPFRVFSDGSSRKCPAGVTLLLCVSNSFHFESKLLSSRLWGPNPAHQP